MPVLGKAQRRAHVWQDVVRDEEDLAHWPAALGQQPCVHLQGKLLWYSTSLNCNSHSTRTSLAKHCIVKRQAAGWQRAADQHYKEHRENQGSYSRM